MILVLVRRVRVTGFARPVLIGGDKPGLTTAERTELVRLRRENSKLRMERELPKRVMAFGVEELRQ